MLWAGRPCSALWSMLCGCGGTATANSVCATFREANECITTESVFWNNKHTSPWQELLFLRVLFSHWNWPRTWSVPSPTRCFQVTKVAVHKVQPPRGEHCSSVLPVDDSRASCFDSRSYCMVDIRRTVMQPVPDRGDDQIIGWNELNLACTSTGKWCRFDSYRSATIQSPVAHDYYRDDQWMTVHS